MSSSKKIDYKIILQRDGQSQDNRVAAELDPAYAPIDSRMEEHSFEFIKEFAKQVSYYDADTLEKNGTWEEFFNFSDQELKSFYKNRNTPPHLALMQSFIRLMEKPKSLLNTLTKRHLDFYYNEVLKLKKLEPKPDRAHVLFELKKNTNPSIIHRGARLNAGKDQEGNELHYFLLHDLVVNHSQIGSLKSLYVHPKTGTLHFAPVANSADGLGDELEKKNPVWKPFGSSNMPAAQVGFCLASPVVAMQEGEREIRVTPHLTDLSEEAFSVFSKKALFNIKVTGEEGWINADLSETEIKPENRLNLIIKIPNTERGIASYHKELHGGSYETKHPILQILIRPENNRFYSAVRDVGVASAEIGVEVKGVTNLRLENDFGILDPKKPFLPFGPVPDRAANFYLAYDEAFKKSLQSFTLKLNWKNIPESDLSDHYKNYKINNKTIVKGNSYFSASVSIPANGNWNSTRSVQLFNAKAQEPQVINFSSSSVSYPAASLSVVNVVQLASVMQSKSFLVQKQISKIQLKEKAFIGGKAASKLTTTQKAPHQRKDFMVITLENGFLHKEFRELSTVNLVKYLKEEKKTLDTLKEPLAPELESLTLDYKASTGVVSLKNAGFEDFTGTPIELFHVGAFGEMREHAYQKSQLPFITEKKVKLFPQYHDEGELLIGISGIKAGDSISLLFQVAEGSSDPEKDVEDLSWNVLCDNYWKKLGEDDIISDETMSFMKSGAIRMIIPKEATDRNTILPEGMIWLKASVKKNTEAACDMINVHTNAATVELEKTPDVLGYFSKTLPSGSITKLANPVSAIKSISQPYTSFGGDSRERDNSFYTRVSERLRHKDRAISLWDFERIVLQKFKNLYKVKCINHASADSFYAPGHISLVVIPDLENKDEVNRLKPKVDKKTLKEVEGFLSSRISSWVTLHVMNPEYEEIKLFFQVKFKQGIEFNNYRPVLNQDVISFLSPWISGKSGEISFGGKIYKSVIIKFIESLDYVDYISDIKMFRNGESKDLEFASPSNPRSILVSSPQHDINSI